MKAACPECFDNTTKKARGCAKCKETGRIEIGMMRGLVYAPTCNACGQPSMGMHIVEEGESFDPSCVEGAVCVSCGAEDLRWELAGHTVGDELDEDAHQNQT